MTAFPFSRWLWLAGCGLLLTSLPAMADDRMACTAGHGITPICSFQRPEDLEPLPGGKAIIVSEYGSLRGTRPGKLSLFRLADGAISPLYPPASAAAPAQSSDAPWGDPTCPGPPGAEFSPHGIHHSAIGGSDRLLVVNHGGREAIELFELTLAPDGAAATLTWRGCVPVPDGVWLNDVAGLPDGALVVSNMIERGTPEDALVVAEAAHADTGYALEWQPAAGWKRLAGTDGGLPNGLEISPDAKTLYVNQYFGDRVIAVDRASGKRLWKAAVDSPDNSSWADDGRLLVASHHADLHTVFACAKVAAPTCALPFTIVAIDPGTGATTPLLAGGEPPLGAATVAVQVGPELFLGSFVGDRIGRVKLE